VRWTLIDDSLHNPLNQALAVVSASQQASAAREFAAFILSDSGQPVMQKYGFVLPAETISIPAP
jgi:molybdate transport system substrate-binding protein